jgi:hypothetical protein
MRGTYFANTAGVLGSSFLTSLLSLPCLNILHYHRRANRLILYLILRIAVSLAVYYNTFNWAVPKFTGDGQNVYSSIISGALSGALFQSTCSFFIPRPSSFSSQPFSSGTAADPLPLAYCSWPEVDGDGSGSYGCGSGGLEPVQGEIHVDHRSSACPLSLNELVRRKKGEGHTYHPEESHLYERTYHTSSIDSTKSPTLDETQTQAERKPRT